jgi:hypothetical protein
MKQLPFLRKKIEKYADYSKATLKDIFDESQLESTIIKEIVIDKSIYLENNGNGFTVKILPEMAQISPIRGFYIEDVDKDGNLDAILIANSYAPEVGTGRSDASLGTMLKGLGKGDFEVVSTSRSGIITQGEVRQIIKINSKKPFLIVSKRSDSFIKLTSSRN